MILRRNARKELGGKNILDIRYAAQVGEERRACMVVETRDIGGRYWLVEHYGGPDSIGSSWRDHKAKVFGHVKTIKQADKKLYRRIKKKAREIAKKAGEQLEDRTREAA